MRRLTDSEELEAAIRRYENRPSRQKALEQEAIAYLAKLSEPEKPHGFCYRPSTKPELWRLEEELRDTNFQFRA